MNQFNPQEEYEQLRKHMHIPTTADLATAMNRALARDAAREAAGRATRTVQARAAAGGGKATGAVYAPTEDQIQAAIIEALRLHGYVVKTTVRRRKKCWQCGSWPRGGDGVALGVGDLLVRWPGNAKRPAWPTGVWLNGDIKKPGGRLSPEQQEAVAAGELFVWHDHEEALADCERGGGIE